MANQSLFRGWKCRQEKNLPCSRELPARRLLPVSPTQGLCHLGLSWFGGAQRRRRHQLLVLGLPVLFPSSARGLGTDRLLGDVGGKRGCAHV